MNDQALWDEPVWNDMKNVSKFRYSFGKLDVLAPKCNCDYTCQCQPSFVAQVLREISFAARMDESLELILVHCANVHGGPCLSAGDPENR